MNTEVMTNDQAHCGPLAISKKLGVDSSSVMAQWTVKWRDKGTDRSPLGVPLDTHSHHKAFFKSRNQGMTMLDVPQRGAIVLLSKDFWTRHWCIIHDFSSTDVYLDWLDGTIRKMTHAEFNRRFNAWPKFMYKIGGPEVKLTLFDRLVLFASGLFN